MLSSEWYTPKAGQYGGPTCWAVSGTHLRLVDTVVLRALGVRALALAVTGRLVHKTDLQVHSCTQT